MKRSVSIVALAALLAGCTGLESEDVARQVEGVERAFARTMAERDFAAFRAFLSDEAVFISGERPLRGKKAVADDWARYFEGEQAPFSWEPAMVEVLESGRLALSSGPVYGADGTRIATFTSVWRQEQPGVWRIVFDRGTRHCE